MPVSKGTSGPAFSALEVRAKKCLELLYNGESVSADDLATLMRATFKNKALRARLKQLRSQSKTVNELVQLHIDQNPPLKVANKTSPRSNPGSTKSNKPMTTYEKLWGRKPYRL
jgi:hypothetical protein